MRALEAGDVLSIAELGSRQSPTSTVLRILALADAGDGPTDPAALPLGARDRLLLQVRQHTLGVPLEVVEACPRCDTQLEFALQTSALLTGDPGVQSGSLEFQHEALVVRFRLPRSEDLLHVETVVDEWEASRALVQRCVESATRAGAPVDTADPGAGLSDAEMEALNTAMVAADPQADLTLELHCAECGHRFERELDVARFFLDELEAMARRLFADIYTLARGYGWSESDILSMSAWRRRAYVEMLV